MAFTQADLDNLNAAIVGSELEVEYQGRRVRFRSVAELKEAYKHVKGELAQQAAATTGTRSSFRFNFATTRE
jgi:hypothetical protein